MTELRDLIADHLIGTGNHDWETRVCETFAMDPDVGLPPFGELPWLSVRQVGTTVDLDRVPTEAFEVWIHAPNTSFAVLDRYERQVVQLLNDAVLVDPDATPPRLHTLHYSGTLLGDQVIPPWDAYARGLRFQTPPGTGIGGEGQHDDPRAQWLRSLGVDLYQCFGEDWCLVTDPTSGQAPTDDCPLVYIRPLTGPEFVTDPPSNFWMTWFRQRLAIHIVAPSVEARDKWVDRVALALPRIVYGPDGETWFLTVISTDYAADPTSVGQIIVELRFAVLSCPWKVQDPPMKEAAVAAVTASRLATLTPPPSSTNPRPVPILPSALSNVREVHRS